MYIITVRRITSGEPLKYRKRLRIAGGHGTPLPRLKLICSDSVAYMA